jgi:hypothetical protein
MRNVDDDDEDFDEPWMTEVQEEMDLPQKRSWLSSEEEGLWSSWAKPVLDFDQILDGLYQGSMPPTGTVLKDEGFDMVVLTAEEYQPADEHFPGVKVVRAYLDDAGRPMEPKEWQQAVEAAFRVAKALSKGHKVLVTCAAGWNRSGVTSALSLHILTGMSGEQAIKQVQDNRQNALCNSWFRAMLRQLEAA